MAYFPLPHIKLSGVFRARSSVTIIEPIFNLKLEIMASNRSKFPWTPPQYQRDRNATEPQKGKSSHEIRSKNDNHAEKTNAQNANETMQRQPELPFGLLLKKAARGDTHTVTVEEALEHLETIAKARIDASLDPELDPEARVNMWLSQSKDYLLQNGDVRDRDCFKIKTLDEDESAITTLGSLSMMSHDKEK